jgi:hypothetical protein
MPLPEGQVWGAAARDPLERYGNSLEGAFGSRSRRGLARGWAPSPRARRICTEVAPYPSSGAEFRPRVAGPIVSRAVDLWAGFVRVFGFVLRSFFTSLSGLPLVV